MQERDGKLVPIIFGGRVLTDPKKRYSTTDKELLGLYNAVKKCEYYLIGHQYVVHTDHKPLIYLKAFKDIVHKRFRWIEYLESVNTVIRYIPGAENIISDYISRNIKSDEVSQIIDACYLDLNLITYTEYELMEIQRNDAELLTIINFLQDSSKQTIIKQFRRYKSKLFTDTNP